MCAFPEGWTDDLTIHVMPGQTLEELVDFVIAADGAARPRIELLEVLSLRFGLSFDEDVPVGIRTRLRGLDAERFGVTAPGAPYGQGLELPGVAALSDR